MFGKVFPVFAVACLLGACSLMSEPLAVAVLGAGTSTALGHSLNGTAYRTFTGPMAEVRQATMDALTRMGIRVESVETVDEGELLTGSAANRVIYIDLERITQKATRMRVVAKNGGILYDSATATEIVLQTEKVFHGEEEFSSSRGASKRVKR
jgi:hypothetical protein